jgi:hypothetical protein
MNRCTVKSTLGKDLYNQLVRNIGKAGNVDSGVFAPHERREDRGHGPGTEPHAVFLIMEPGKEFMDWKGPGPA